jgi:7,8-dihydropterin-6-yl-methyl-4-(beta-D-ribofuranosyl)aminobenzene 5'-phosphate synthase
MYGPSSRWSCFADSCQHRRLQDRVDAATRLAKNAWMERIGLEPVDSVTITTIIDNGADLLAATTGRARQATYRGPRVGSALMEEGRLLDGLVAEHGYSALIEIRRGTSRSTVLYDAGMSPFGVRDNMRRLQIEPKDIEAAVMSHGHYDHTTGLEGIIGDLGRSGVPMVLHPHFWNRRRLRLEGTEHVEIPTPSRSYIESMGVQIIETREPSFLFDSGLLVTGEVRRTTGFERGMDNQEALKDGVWVDDGAVLDDQAAVLDVAGKGLVVLTGCGHAGVVNILRHARELTGVERIHAVIGGFHLTGKAFEPIIERTVDAVAAFEPDLVVPAHCTGWKAALALASRMPEAVVPNAVGATFEL